MDPREVVCSASGSPTCCCPGAGGGSRDRALLRDEHGLSRDGGPRPDRDPGRAGATAAAVLASRPAGCSGGRGCPPRRAAAVRARPRSSTSVGSARCWPRSSRAPGGPRSRGTGTDWWSRPLVFALLSFVVPGFFVIGTFTNAVPLVAAAWLGGAGLRRWEGRSERSAEDARADERATIARELHDVIAHHVSVMVVQSGSARLLMDTDTAGSEVALRNVERTGREALVEMRRMLGVLDGRSRRAAHHPSTDPRPSRAAHRDDGCSRRHRAAGPDRSARCHFRRRLT